MPTPQAEQNATAHPNALPKWEVPSAGELVADKYRVLDVLGQGGLAVVLAAMHVQLEQKVALKFLLPDFADDAEIAERFLREGQAVIQIKSEHVVRVLDVCHTESGAPFIVLEYLDGMDLETLLSMQGPQPIDTAVDYVVQACEAIAEAHTLGIVHRDLKPANLFLTHRADGSPCIKVLDFGISKVRKHTDTDRELTNPTMVMGSPHYMSPEQLQSTKDADEKSDIWALGAILHELLAGSPPFKGDTAPELCVNVMRDPPQPLAAMRSDVPPALEATVLLCLEKDPLNRFANVGELAMALATFGPPSAHASADRTVRTLQAAGIIPTAATTSGLWLTASPAARSIKSDPPRSLETTGPRSRAAVDDDDVDFRVKKSRPALLTIAIVALFGGVGLGVFLLFARGFDTRMNTTTVQTPTTSTFAATATATPREGLPPNPPPPPASALAATPPATPAAATTTTAAPIATTTVATKPAIPVASPNRRRGWSPYVAPAPAPVNDNPYVAPAPTPRPSPQPTSDPDKLFDERK
jgi:serine/threonine protein kinase